MYTFNDADTVPPKKLITNMSQDFYAAGFCPGALVNFSYDVSKGELILSEDFFFGQKCIT